MDGRVEASRNILNLVLLRIDLDLYSQLCKQRLEALIERLSGLSLFPQVEQKAQVDLVMIWIEPMSGQDGVVGCKDRAEWVGMDVRVLLRAGNNFVQDTNI